MSGIPGSVRASHWTCRADFARVKKGDAVFGWLRKRSHDDEPTIGTDTHATPARDAARHEPQQAAPLTPELSSSGERFEVQDEQMTSPTSPEPFAHMPGQPEQEERDRHELAPRPSEIVLAAPSMSPSMPLGEHPNILGLVDDVDAEAPRLLDPSAALSEVTREQLTMLLTDLFGARGRYRLEWRPNREASDDAMFAETMVADLVRRIQNTIAESAEIEAGPAARRRELRGPRAHRELGAGDDEERERVVEAFLNPKQSDEELVATLTPETATRRRRRA